ncbi:alpha/beta fold hydrolase [Corynebacterium yudongzhengii]|uniref:alpha/beta fold hydrolase n=1 Tax=Corynebacterium yudongzhengii TaxID=2080740 RepID=UPI001F47BB66|nr:alpha/beta hydrolase [Corynebacterium yudongzhengii]
MARSRPRPDVVELDGPFDHAYVHARGLRLHVAIAGAPGAPLVLLLPDAFGGWYDYAQVIAPLAARGFRVAAVDPRGYGLSDKPPYQSGFSARSLVSDLAGLIPALGYEKASVIGADTGGTLAWILATTHPARVDHLVSISSAHPVDLRRAVAARPWDFLWMLQRHLLFHLPATALTRAFGLIEREIRHFGALNTSARFHRTEAFQEMQTLRAKAGRIDRVPTAIVHTARVLMAPLSLKHQKVKVCAPTLILHAPQSLWARLIDRTRERVAPGTMLTATSLPGAKNLPHIEAPEAFVEAVASFLGKA